MRKFLKIAAITIFILAIIDIFIGKIFDAKSCRLVGKDTTECSYIIKRWKPDTIEKYDEEKGELSVFNKETGELVRQERLK